MGRVIARFAGIVLGGRCVAIRNGNVLTARANARVL